MTVYKINIDKCNEERDLLDLFIDKKIILESPCGGKGICGKCKIKIIDGQFNDITDKEVNFLSREEMEEGYRLACLTLGKGEIQVEIPENNGNHKILTDGYMPDVEFHPIISKVVVKVEESVTYGCNSYEDIVCSTEKTNDLEIIKKINKLARNKEITVVYSGDSILDIEDGNSEGKNFGVAIDIGTTTVVASLIDLNLGTEIGSDTSINPQKEYGLDVLTRIDFINRRENGLEILKSTIVECLNKLIGNLCEKHSLGKENIYEVCIGANTTMMHILLGVSTETIGRAPYKPLFVNEKYIKAKSIGINIAEGGMIYCLPGVSSYIGADIVAGVMVSGLKDTNKNILFIDIGTNGEIVLSKAGKLASCSCAAGPAFEGMNISCGMRAAEGAIEEINIQCDKIDLKTIGGKTPIGICGSGILELISELWRNKLIGKTGRIKTSEDVLKSTGSTILAGCIDEVEKKRRVIISKEFNIFITQEDIRHVQLAKGAISSGFYSLLDTLNLSMDELDEVIISGQFGKHLKISSLVGVGIIPKELEDKVTYIGNSSKTGALMCLTSKEVRNKIQRVATGIDYFELSTKEGYDRLFTKCLNF
ncbi:MAG: ASKHA domain-containing protein [Clostridium sp.]